jgi:hypothetical protein
MVTVVRAIIEANRELGIEARDGASLFLRQVDVLGTRPRDCSESTCPTEPGGHGIGVYETGVIEAADVTVEGSFLCGLHVVRPQRVSVSGVTLRRNTVGLCVQEAERLDSRGIVFDDNGNDVEPTDFYVPEPAPVGAWDE